MATGTVTISMIRNLPPGLVTRLISASSGSQSRYLNDISEVTTSNDASGNGSTGPLIF